MATDLPTQHRALVLNSIEEGFQVKTAPTPKPDPGSAIVKILQTGVLSYHREIYNGQRGYPFPTPLVGGANAIGRIAALGPDAATLQPGQLVFVDMVVRARDDPSVLFLSAIHAGGSEGSQKLMRDVWRDGTFAEYTKVPLENCIPLDETRLCQGLGYSLPDLMYLSTLLVPFGGLRDIGLEPGETVIVCPATGGFGSAGVQVAAAMRVRVIAYGRNEKELARVKERVSKGTQGATIETVKMTGDEHADTAALMAFGTVDAVLDISSPAAAKSTHTKSAIHALRNGGRCSLMGSAEGVVDWKVMSDNITIKGRFMYERDNLLLFVKMLERGLFPRGGEGLVDVKSYGLESWKEAFDVAAEHVGIGKMVVFTPWMYRRCK